MKELTILKKLKCGNRRIIRLSKNCNSDLLRLFTFRNCHMIDFKSSLVTYYYTLLHPFKVKKPEKLNLYFVNIVQNTCQECNSKESWNFKFLVVLASEGLDAGEVISISFSVVYFSAIRKTFSLAFSLAITYLLISILSHQFKSVISQLRVSILTSCQISVY